MLKIESSGEIQSPEPNELTALPSTRTLKIEKGYDRSGRKIKPKIRLTGKWLERAGFKPGQRTKVKFMAPGVIELRSYSATT